MSEMTLKELASSGRAGAGVEPECWKPEEQCTYGSRDKNVAGLRRGGEVLCRLGCKLLDEA